MINTHIPMIRDNDWVFNCVEESYNDIYYFI